MCASAGDTISVITDVGKLSAVILVHGSTYPVDLRHLTHSPSLPVGPQEGEQLAAYLPVVMVEAAGGGAGAQVAHVLASTVLSLVNSHEQVAGMLAAQVAAGL